MNGNIELRSEKVRRLLGEIPPTLVRNGTIILVVIFIALVCAFVCIPGLGEAFIGMLWGK